MMKKIIIRFGSTRQRDQNSSVNFICFTEIAFKTRSRTRNSPLSPSVLLRALRDCVVFLRLFPAFLSVSSVFSFVGFISRYPDDKPYRFRATYFLMRLPVFYVYDACLCLLIITTLPYIVISTVVCSDISNYSYE